MKTKVLFYKIERDDIFPIVPDDIFAVFPLEPASLDPEEMMCYAHFGQHGGCLIDALKGRALASPEEYRSLKEELEEIGYELEILKAMPRNAKRVRLDSILKAASELIEEKEKGGQKLKTSTGKPATTDG